MLRLIDSVEILRSLDPEMQAQTMLIFLLIANRDPDPISMTDLARQSGVAQSSVSRNVASLGSINRHKMPGLQLVDSYEDPKDLRKKLVKLTPSGRRIINLLENRYHDDPSTR